MSSFRNMSPDPLFYRLVKRPLGLTAFVVLVILYGLALFAPFIAPYEASKQNLNYPYHPPMRVVIKEGKLQAQQYEVKDLMALEYAPVVGRTVPLNFFAEGYAYKLFGFIPMVKHLVLLDTKDADARLYLFGADNTGRDVFSRLLYGAQISLTIGFIGISITMVLGFFVGGLAGFFRGKFDFISMRFVEFLMVIPGLYLLLALRSTLAPYFDSDKMFIVIVVILSLIGWAGTARVIRGMAIALRSRPFVEASITMGQGTMNILRMHILPNLVSYLLVAATLSIPGYILGEAALSFLGLGIQEPEPSWGLMLKQAQDMKIFMLNLWWLLLPGGCIFITVIAFNILGDELRDIVDPRMAKK